MTLSSNSDICLTMNTMRELLSPHSRLPFSGSLSLGLRPRLTAVTASRLSGGGDRQILIAMNASSQPMLKEREE